MLSPAHHGRALCVPGPSVQGGEQPARKGLRQGRDESRLHPKIGSISSTGLLKSFITKLLTVPLCAHNPKPQEKRLFVCVPMSVVIYVLINE